MNFLEVDKLIIFILFIVPGFIAIKTYNFLYPSNIKFSEQVVDAVSYSSINYALWIVPSFYTYKYYMNIGSFFVLGALAVVVLFISPVGLAFFWKWIRGVKYFQKFAVHPIGKPWDYYFAKKKTGWVIVNMNSGKKLGGSYGVDSFSSSYLHEEQIYIDEEWVINADGGFERIVEQSAGIIIFLKDAESVSFYYSGDELNDD
ncbi:DUF6338 family protein [Psychrobacter glacincola]|uniref:DUF6338 family protein n=1 Tax=Psychrobacter glacincola TaxID=56810 RepID=UPI00191A4297|nr:DUF6338 family protein [Psychrobacter glacincola]